MNRVSEPVPLAVKSYGDSGMAVVFLHGLLGSSRNWRHIAGMMADRYRVFVPDLRNHGESPRTGAFGFEDLADDVAAWISSNLYGEPVTLVGHSLGGKAAMKLAVISPELVERLVVVDITSEAAPRRWGPVFEAMSSLDLSTLKNRGDAEAHFEKAGFSDWAMRKFLAGNLLLDGGKWRWKVGLAALSESAPNFVRAVLNEGERYDGPTLLLRGKKSGYAPEKDFKAMHAHFPRLEIMTVENAGHNVHIDTPQSFVVALESFIRRTDMKTR